ncbi:phosphate/phosphite/phosphonate ABC transporter substrate-binding protein [Pseudophaeobacter flagellatus]|uniref:phosphate/phosphite/phosphonate ABC transporter substrate-binding protein n=1 Tax=Pseudophaeobacter flagellatus TaxID=2899119 RepID=UPI001E420BDA|nr:PhnD/SsuA/transferrin family substrate-binding protein [Pseudophaeobacter flagellatus]MCD9146566.1 PhnD/SsuA/transferrin family substrate-binding protein [Pseudophaeobacter flagellatus]
MIAYLGMYDRPETAEANDLFWAAIRNNLDLGPEKPPEALNRDIDPWEAWNAPDLLLAQTCGCPFRTRLYGEVDLVGTPDYGLPDCPPGYYRSVFVAKTATPLPRLKDFDRARFAYNDGLSQSGWAAPLIHMQDLGILPGELVETGGHRASALAVAEGRADFAALDILSWELIQKYDAFADQLCVFERTAPTPGLPFITALSQDPVQIYQAIADAIEDLDPSTRAALHLTGILQIPMSEYLSVPTPPGPVLTGLKIAARS